MISCNFFQAYIEPLAWARWYMHSHLRIAWKIQLIHDLIINVLELQLIIPPWLYHKTCGHRVVVSYIQVGSISQEKVYHNSKNNHIGAMSLSIYRKRENMGLVLIKYIVGTRTRDAFRPKKIIIAFQSGRSWLWGKGG